MKTLNTHWKLIALGTFAVMVTIWAGSRMEAKTGQDYTAQSARVSPQARESANQIGLIIQAGITRGETLRFGAFHSADAGCRTQEQMRLTVFDSQGNVVVQQLLMTVPNQTVLFDLNADQLAQSFFDDNGRAELIGLLSHPGRVDAGGVPGGGCVVAGEVFDNRTGRTLVHIAGTPLLRCGGGND